jgi:hypothetical protein
MCAAMPPRPTNRNKPKADPQQFFLMKKRDNPQPKQATVTKYATDRTMNNETAKNNRATTHVICKIREARAYHLRTKLYPCMHGHRFFIKPQAITNPCQ